MTWKTGETHVNTSHRGSQHTHDEATAGRLGSKEGEFYECLIKTGLVARALPRLGQRHVSERLLKRPLCLTEIGSRNFLISSRMWGGVH